MRVTTKPVNQYPWYLRPFFWKQQRKYGQVLEPGLVWGRSPKLFMGVAFLYGMIERRGRWSPCASRRSTTAGFASTSTPPR